jgi:hypothetical protein
MRVLAVFLDHAALGFALRFGIFAIGLVLSLLHFADSPRLRPRAGDLIGIAGQRQTRAEDGQKNPRSDLSCVHFSDGQILAAETQFRERGRSGVLKTFFWASSKKDAGMFRRQEDHSRDAV